MSSIVKKAYAKINLGLKVVGKREDGFHDIDTIMVPIKLHDAVMIEKLKHAREHFVTTDDLSIGLRDKNTAMKSLELLDKKVHLKDRLKVTIHKAIPMKAGLGGGCSDAASTLLGVNHLYKLGLTNDEMIKMALKIGSDVPFFIDPKPMRCEGRGEIFSSINIKNDYYVILVKPESGIHTKESYDEYDKLKMHSKSCDINKVLEALEKGDDDLLAASISNDLQEGSIKLLPEIGEIIKELKSFGLKIVLMSGSGSTVFGLSNNKKLLLNIEEKLENKYFVEVTKIIK